MMEKVRNCCGMENNNEGNVHDCDDDDHDEYDCVYDNDCYDYVCVN